MVERIDVRRPVFRHEEHPIEGVFFIMSLAIELQTPSDDLGLFVDLIDPLEADFLVGVAHPEFRWLPAGIDRLSVLDRA
jgi:hypothetical protein